MEGARVEGKVVEKMEVSRTGKRRRKGRSGRMMHTEERNKGDDRLGERRGEATRRED